MGRTLCGVWVLSGGGRCVRVGGMWGSVVAICEAGVMGGSNEVLVVSGASTCAILSLSFVHCDQLMNLNDFCL